MARIKIGNIKGPKGDTGARGATGPAGPTGPQGPLPPLTNNFLATVAGQSALDAAAGKVLKDQLDQQNSDFTSYINTVGKTSWSGIETITTVASTWKQCTKSITLDPGTYIFVGHACAPAGDNAGTIRIDNIDAVESYQYFGPNTALRKVNVSLFWNITKRTTFTLSVWCSASGVSVIDCEVSAIRLK